MGAAFLLLGAVSAAKPQQKGASSGTAGKKASDAKSGGGDANEALKSPVNAVGIKVPGGTETVVPVKSDQETKIKVSGDYTNREGNGDNLPYPGVDYLGIGYDLLRGNPEGDPDTFIDPGFRLPVAALHWSQDNDGITRDVRDLHPVEGWAVPETSRNHAQTSTHTTTMEEYEKELSMSASVSAGYEGGVASAAFSASVGSESFQSDVVEQEKERYEMTSYCLKYRVGLNNGNNSNVVGTPYFQAKAKALPKVEVNECPDGVENCIDLFNYGAKQFLTVKCTSSLSDAFKNGLGKMFNKAADLVGHRRRLLMQEQHSVHRRHKSIFKKNSEGDFVTDRASVCQLKFVSEASADTKWDWKKDTVTSQLVHISSGTSLRISPDGKSIGLADAGQGTVWTRDIEASTLTCKHCKVKEGGDSKEKRPPKSAKRKKTSADFTLLAAQAPVANDKVKGNKAGLVVPAAKALAEFDENVMWQKWGFTVTEDHKQIAWSEFFSEFGTHYIDSMHLGGRMSHMVTIDQESKQEIEKAGLDVAASVEGAYGPATASAEASMSKKEGSQNAFSNAKKEIKTIVLGGNPPESGADEPSGFAEWAASVAEHPMPVKYSLRPLYEIGDVVDKNTYDIMVQSYMAQMLKKRKGDLLARKHNQKHGGAAGGGKGGKGVEPPQLKPGDSLSSDSDGLHHDGYDLILKPDGRLIIQDKLSTVLWDSLSIDWQCNSNGDCGGGTDAPFTLKYETNGDLWIYGASGKKLWHSVTDINTCGGQGAGKVVFEKGQLSIKSSANEVVWTTGTSSDAMGRKGTSQRATRNHFGQGDNKCITDKNCATIFDDYKFGGNRMDMKPGDYNYGALSAKNMDDNGYSYRVAKERCYVRLWEGENFDDYEDFLVQDTNDDCHTINLSGQKGEFYMGCNDANSMKVYTTSDWQMFQLFAKGQNDGSGYMRQNSKLRSFYKSKGESMMNQLLSKYGFSQ